MKNIYSKLRDSSLSIHIYSIRSGENRAKEAVQEIFHKISNAKYDLTQTKTVLINLSSGSQEITIDEIGIINDSIQNKIPEVNIIMGVQEKDISNDLEIQFIATDLEIDGEKIDTNEVFNSNSFPTETLPIYFLQDEYSTLEISEIISFLSELYQDIGGDELKISGFQSKLVKLNLEPTFL